MIRKKSNFFSLKKKNSFSYFRQSLSRKRLLFAKRTPIRTLDTAGYPASFSRGIQRRSRYRSSIVRISSVVRTSSVVPILSNDCNSLESSSCQYFTLPILTQFRSAVVNFTCVCDTVSSMLSGLECRSLGHIRHNVDFSLVTVCPCRSVVHRFLGLTSTKQGVDVTCSRPQRTEPGWGSNHGPLGPKSGAITTAPVSPKNTILNNFSALYKLISPTKRFYIFISTKPL